LNRAAPIVALLLAGMVAIAAVALLRGDDDPAAPESPAPATFADYWKGDARWALERKLTVNEIGGTEGPQSGAHMEIVGDRWYLFNRSQLPGTCSSGEARIGVQVRESRDRGATWTPPVRVIDPAPGTAWSCAATDGDAFYDPTRKTWGYLFQCKPDGGGWNGCYVERRAESPMAPFDAVGENPVIRGGELWREICDPGDRCGGQNLVDEGTFNIFDHRDDSYWISFHGSDGTQGFRGIARTDDFRRFVVDRPDEGVPSDAILDASDATAFREQWAPGGPIGAGAGAIVREGDHLYALNEFADVSLRCTEGQNWDLGLFRAESTASARWEPLPAGNPIVASSRAPESNGRSLGCNVLYPTLFRDPATDSWYMMHGRGSTDPAFSGLYVYRLVRDSNLLENGDLAAGNAWPWSRLPDGATNVDVPRMPNGSPDGTPYLAFNCGPACSAESSVLQDVPVNPGFEGRRFDYGGTLRTDGGDGALTLAVHQLDARGTVIHTDALDLTVGAGYAEHVAAGSVREGARKLRYQLYPKSPQTFAADNLFLRVTG
jgi:hypothetical protein